MDEELFETDLTEEDILARMNGDDDDEDQSSTEEDADDEEDQADEDSQDEEADETDPDDDEEGDEDEAEDSEDEESEDDSSDDEEEGDDEDEASTVADEAEVTVTVNGEEKRVSVGELKRLAGQEAALTQKSQSIAEQRKVVEAQGQYVTKVLQDRYQAAKERQKKFEGVDLYKARQELDDDEFESLRDAKESADAEVSAIENEAKHFMENAQQTRQKLLREQAKEARKVIQEHIPEWSDELYGQIRSYAVEQGMDAKAVNEIIDPSAILMMHKAMKFDQAQKKASTVKKKATKTPKKVNKKSANKTDPKASRLKALQRKAQETGDPDDIAAMMEAASEE